MRTIILIWGAAILLYLLLIYRSGTSSLLSGSSNFVNSLTRTLQGR